MLQAPKQFLLVCEEPQSEHLIEEIQNVWDKLAVDPAPVALTQVEKVTHDQHEAWLIQANVQFCAAAYPAVEVSHPDAAALMVLAGYLRNGFLHSAIREKAVPMVVVRAMTAMPVRSVSTATVTHVWQKPSRILMRVFSGYQCTTTAASTGRSHSGADCQYG